LSNIPIRAYKNWEMFYVLLPLLWEPTYVYLLVSLVNLKKIDYVNMCLEFFLLLMGITNDDSPMS
jgi:hypothetical protein